MQAPALPAPNSEWGLTIQHGAGMLAADGRCKTLDAAADGYMRGEGCIVHLLQAFQPDQLEAAHLMDQAAVLHGTAVNQDGRSSSLTVRSPFIAFCA